MEEASTSKKVITLIALLVIILGVSVGVTYLVMESKKSSLIDKYGQQKAEQIIKCREAGFSDDYCLDKVIGEEFWKENSAS